MKAFDRLAKKARSVFPRKSTKVINGELLARCFRFLFSGPFPTRTKGNFNFLQVFISKSRFFQFVRAKVFHFSTP